MELITTTEKTSPSRKEVWLMFDRIARRYDLLNHLLSFGQDIFWRRRVCRFLPYKSKQSILDIATGTADQLITIVNYSRKISSAVGIDMAKNMLHIAEQKIAKQNLDKIIRVMEGDASRLNFSDKSFDVVTISFGIRNFERLFQDVLSIFPWFSRHIIRTS